eukprot:TRINITY_DN31685_c0_g1_i4.p2 TRINITY_DN31685_c0_g1~~TRINITY_DN31685_c0_g1_i4.p2  ORF type:complete len:114 (+),score=19.44 TRINITY_DN31685_c0_g1_i4:1239-1580(+)
MEPAQINAHISVAHLDTFANSEVACPTMNATPTQTVLQVLLVQEVDVLINVLELIVLLAIVANSEDVLLIMFAPNPALMDKSVEMVIVLILASSQLAQQELIAEMVTVWIAVL